MFKKRKISNILCGASVVLICIIITHYIMIGNYNNQFTKYIDNIDSYYAEPRYT